MLEEKFRTKIGSMSGMRFAVIVATLTIVTVCTFAVGFRGIWNLLALEAANAWGAYGYDFETLLEMDRLRRVGRVAYVGSISLLINNVVICFYIEEKLNKYKKRKRSR